MNTWTIYDRDVVGSAIELHFVFLVTAEQRSHTRHSRLLDRKMREIGMFTFEFLFTRRNIFSSRARAHDIDDDDDSAV